MNEEFWAMIARLEKINSDLALNCSKSRDKVMQMKWASEAGTVIKEELMKSMDKYAHLVGEIEQYISSLKEHDECVVIMKEQIAKSKEFVEQNKEKLKELFLSIPDSDTPEWIMLEKVIRCLI